MGGQLGELAGGALFQDRMARTRIKGSKKQNLRAGSIGSETAYSSRLGPSVPSGMLKAWKLVMPWSCQVAPPSKDR